MKVRVQVDKDPEIDAEFFCAGQCIGLQFGNSTIRIALTTEQWGLLAISAKGRTPDENKR